MSLLALAFSSLVVVAPVAPLPDLPVPLGRLTDVLGGPLVGGVPNDEAVVEFQPGGCDHKVTLNLSRLLGGAGYSLQQLQDWMGRTEGLERSIFVKPGQLATVAKRALGGTHADQQACTAPKLGEGFKLQLLTAPRLCKAAAGRTLGEHWFLSEGKPAAVAQISGPPAESAEKCLPRVSLVLFDDRQTPRLRYHADFGGLLSVTLVGDRCQDVDFTLDQQAQVFHAARRSCKR